MNILLITKQNKEEELDLYYEDYEVKYNIQDLPEEICKLYENPNYFNSKSKSIGMSEPNRFIVNEIKQLENEDSTKQIELVYQDESNRIWLK